MYGRGDTPTSLGSNTSRRLEAPLMPRDVEQTRLESIACTAIAYTRALHMTMKARLIKAPVILSINMNVIAMHGIDRGDEGRVQEVMMSHVADSMLYMTACSTCQRQHALHANLGVRCMS